MRRLLWLVVAAVAACAAPASRTSQPPPVTIPACEGLAADAALLCETVELIRDRYVDPVDQDTLVQAALEGVEAFASPPAGEAPPCAPPEPAFAVVCRAVERRGAPDGVEAAVTGMVEFALDPNSAYLDPEAVAIAAEDTAGRIEGIGAFVSAERPAPSGARGSQCSVVSSDCRLVVLSTLPGSPAEQAGLEEGDVIVSVDGVDVVGMTFHEVTTRVRGPAGSEVALGVERGDRRLTLGVVREAIDVPVAEWERVGSVGYLRLNAFTASAGRQVREALTELSGVETLVLDLRGNPGGTLDSAVEVASEFLAEGVVVRTEAPGGSTPYQVTGNGIATDPSVEVAVLVDRSSASASEVVAGALQEAGRATVVGAPTFGKNSVQQRIPLSNGGALELTVARWVTPDGTDFGETGITPDVAAALPADLSPTQVVDRIRDVLGW